MATKRVLFISGSLGLGHAVRDLAIVKELRALNPDIEVHWIAPEPAATMIAEAGEHLLPESSMYSDNNAIAEANARGTSLNRPFIYFPIEGHFEQERHVAGRLGRHGAGVRMAYSDATPESLAQKITENIGKQPEYEPIPFDGAEKAASLLNQLLTTPTMSLSPPTRQEYQAVFLRRWKLLALSVMMFASFSAFSVRASYVPYLEEWGIYERLFHMTRILKFSV